MNALVSFIMSLVAAFSIVTADPEVVSARSVQIIDHEDHATLTATRAEDGSWEVKVRVENTSDYSPEEGRVWDYSIVEECTLHCDDAAMDRTIRDARQQGCVVQLR